MPVDDTMGPFAFEGSCHCGAVAVEFRTALEPEEARTHACQCSFCRTHGARTITDPAGAAAIRETHEGALLIYRFGLKTADFILCGRCGVYLGAICEVDGRSYATINVNVLNLKDRFARPSAPAHYDEEDTAQRLKRRKQRWTPLAAPAD